MAEAGGFLSPKPQKTRERLARALGCRNVNRDLTFRSEKFLHQIPVRDSLMCCLELFLVIGGITLICTGRLSLFRVREVRGFPAVAIGMVLLAPVGVVMFLGAPRGFEAGLAGKTFELEMVQDLAGVELIITVFSLFLSFLIAVCCAQKVNRPPPPVSITSEHPTLRLPERGYTRLRSEDFLPPR
jgi:hypothetical protein